MVFLRGVEIARWETRDDCLLAISSESEPPELQGFATSEPAFGVSARWIVPGLREQALALGYAVVDQTSVMATHLAEVIKQHAYELLSRHETKRLLDRLGESQPKLCEELVPKLMSLGEVQKVLQQLLREQVSIRDLPTILESLLDTAAVSKNPVLLVEGARQALGRALVRPLLSEDGGLRVVTLDPGIEEELTRAFSSQAPAGTGGLEPSFVRRVLEGLKKLSRRAGPHGYSGAVLQYPGALPSAPPAGAVSAQGGGFVAGRDSPGHPGAVVGNDPIRRKHECRSSL